jgi:hypothetical protein
MFKCSNVQILRIWICMTHVPALNRLVNDPDLLSGGELVLGHHVGVVHAKLTLAGQPGCQCYNLIYLTTTQIWWYSISFTTYDLKLYVQEIFTYSHKRWTCIRPGLLTQTPKRNLKILNRTWEWSIRSTSWSHLRTGFREGCSCTENAGPPPLWMGPILRIKKLSKILQLTSNYNRKNTIRQKH